jgi:SOS-response transcriptional repressor LexA
VENQGELLRNFFKGTGIPMQFIAETLGMTRQNLNLHLNKEKLSQSFMSLVREQYAERENFPFPKSKLRIEVATKQVHLIPFYESITVGGTKSVANMDSNSEASEMVNAGDWFLDSTGAMRVHGDSMHPKYPSGAIVAFKQVFDMELIVPGQDYMVETTEYRIIKRLQKSKNEKNVLACSYNEETDNKGNRIHEPFDIPLNKITRLFRVLGKVERNESSRIVYNQTK